MKFKNNNLTRNIVYENCNYYSFQNDDFFEAQKNAGKCVRQCLTETKLLIQNSTELSGFDIKNLCAEIIKKNSCVPTFLNYSSNGKPPFPSEICVSVNKELVHGIPSKEKFKNGDVIKIDLGATFENAIADAASTFIFGQPRKQEHIELIQTARKALKSAISNIKIEKRFGTIGHSIYNVVKNSRFKVITDYGGHGISVKNGKGIPHAWPFISNRSILNEGIRFSKGISFAIEPLLVCGTSNQTKLSEDQWTVLCDDVTAHEETTLSIDNYGNITNLVELEWR